MEKLFNESNSNIKKFQKKDDIRIHFFLVFALFNLWLLVHLNTFFLMLDGRNTKYHDYVKFSAVDKIRYLTTHDTFNRISYTSSVMFHVEDFIKNIMKALNKPAKGKYYEFTKQFLKNLGIFTDQRWRILNAPYQLRNSLHNNGIAYDDFFIELEGKKYQFQKGKQIDFAGWDTLYIFFNSLVDVLLESVKTRNLEKIEFIPHSYIIPEVTFPSESPHTNPNDST